MIDLVFLIFMEKAGLFTIITIWCVFISSCTDAPIALRTNNQDVGIGNEMPVGPNLYPAEVISSDAYLYKEQLEDQSHLEFGFALRWIGSDDLAVGQPEGMPKSVFCPHYTMGSNEEQAYFKYSSKIQNKMRQECHALHHKEEAWYNLLHVIDAGILDGARLYADKALFGREAGMDLGDLFYLSNSIDFSIDHYQFNYPDYSLKAFYTEDSYETTTFKYFFSEGTALSFFAVFKLKEIPQEQYDTITLTVEIPVRYVSQYEIIGNPMPDGLVGPVITGTIRGSISF